jgi:hypothetical protein
MGRVRILSRISRISKTFLKVPVPSDYGAPCTEPGPMYGAPPCMVHHSLSLEVGDNLII